MDGGDAGRASRFLEQGVQQRLVVAGQRTPGAFVRACMRMRLCRRILRGWNRVRAEAPEGALSFGRGTVDDGDADPVEGEAGRGPYGGSEARLHGAHERVERSGLVGGDAQIERGANPVVGRKVTLSPSGRARAVGPAASGRRMVANGT